MLPIKIRPNIYIKPNELEIKSIRAQGPGGQNVNKVASAIHLSFNIEKSSLPESYKQRLLNLPNLAQSNTIIFKAQNNRSRERNLQDAVKRLCDFILANTKTIKPRLAIRPSFASKERRIKSKKVRSQIKLTRQANINRNY